MFQSFQNQLENILEFIHPYQNIWNREILYNYPQLNHCYNSQWLEVLNQLPFERLIELDATQNFVSLYPLLDSFQEFHEKQQELTYFPSLSLDERIKNLSPLKDSKTFYKIKEKKEHEIVHLLSFLEATFPEVEFLDIGAGLGHLSRIRALYFNKKGHLLDKNESFLQKAKNHYHREAQYLQKKEDLLNFISLDLMKDKHQLKDKGINSERGILGLHSCGALSNHCIELALNHNSRVLLNFGCCYYHLSAKDLNLSQFLKNHAKKPQLTPEALTLATRKHAPTTQKDIEFKYKVKSYRYALHLYFHRELKINPPTVLGSCPKHLYQDCFENYFLYHYKNIKSEISPASPHPTSLKKFFDDINVRSTIKAMLTQGIIRSLFGRLLESLIILDRALWLEENGRSTSIYQFFDPKISPRNIGIVSTQNRY